MPDKFPIETNIEAIFEYLSERIKDVLPHGYVITGELQITRPVVKHMITVDAVGVKVNDNHGRLELNVTKHQQLVVQEHGKESFTVKGLPIQNDSPTCPDCGTVMMRTGTCYTCPGCAWNGGCG